MRRTPPLILGAGPAGCAAAIMLSEEGLRPILLDRDADAHDQLCGGFLSWRTVEQLRALGVDPPGLGACRVDRLTIAAEKREVAAGLPSPAFGLSRRALDGALRERAIQAGARIETETARSVQGSEVIGRRRHWSGCGLFLATGKHDVRGIGRLRAARDPALGLRLRLPASPALAGLAGRIELHLFAGGYAGIAQHEDGSANVCLAVRKSLLSRCGAPRPMLHSIAARHPHFARRLGHDWQTVAIETIGAVPYGWTARSTDAGVFRLGDQAAVIPSLAGEGISIALASGTLAARLWLEYGPEGAQRFQRCMARLTAAPLRVAGLARTVAESPVRAQLGLALAERVPLALRWMIDASRVRPEASLAHPAAAA